MIEGTGLDWAMLGWSRAVTGCGWAMLWGTGMYRVISGWCWAVQ